MKKLPAYVKVIAVLGLLSGLFGLIIAFKVPGTIAFAPLLLGLIFGLIAFLISTKKKVKCFGSLIAMAISVLGIVITLLLQTKEAEVAVDKNQEQIIEQTNDDITTGDELDDALDELDDLE